MKWFMNLSTQTKLMSAFGAICAMLVVVGVVGITNLTALQKHVDTIADVHMKGSIALAEAQTDKDVAGKMVRQAVLDTGPAETRTSCEAVDKAFKDLKEHLDDAAKIFTGADDAAKIKEMRDIEGPWEANVRQAAQAAMVQQDAQAIALIKIATPQGNEMSTKIQTMRDGEIKQADEATDVSMAAYKKARATMIAIVLLAALFGLALGFFISRGIAGPLAESVRVLDLVAKGDFTTHLDVNTRDEVGRMAASLNQAVESMRVALTEVSSSAANVTNASRELSQASQSISSGAQEQASALEETAASLEEMTSSVKQNADNAQQAAQLAHGAREVAEKGGAVVGSAVEAMTEINASSRKIADIITAIDEIAFQTNLLALNAAVEAARAGEQGRGFAVVAGEVRNLAQRSASAAKEIKGLITDSVDKVEAGSKLVNQSGQTLAEIVTSVKHVTDIVTEIAASSREQSTGIEQVNTAVTQMDAVTQSNASQTEELAGTAEGLAAQAQQMTVLVQRFNLGGGHKSHADAPAVRASSPAKPNILSLPKRHAKQAAPAPTHAATGTDGGFEEF